MTPEQLRKKFGPALDKAGYKLSRAYFMMSKTMEYTEEFASENSAQYVDAVHGFISGAKWADNNKPKKEFIDLLA